MAEYIEKWPVVNRLIDIENEFQQYNPFHGFEHAMYRKICEAEIAIGKTQAADVAPVVHCKDCKYWQDNNDGYPHEECRWGHGETPDADDFCSYGERKDGDGNG